MEILFVRNLFRPQDFGGNRYPWEVTRRLGARDHHVRILTPKLGGPLPGAAHTELIHYPVSRRTPFETFFTNAICARAAIRLQSLRCRPDVILLSSYDVAFGHFWVAREGPPAVYIYHSSFYSDAVDRVATKPWPLRLAHDPLQRFTRFVEELVFRRSDHIIAVSPFSKREIEARSPDAARRTSVIPTGVDSGLFSPGDRAASRRLFGIGPRDRLIAVIGRLAPVKRYDRAIDVLHVLRKTDPAWSLVIAGTGPAEADLRRYAATAGGAVRFAGFVDGPRLRDLYRAADVVLCTSEFENWSLSILEALATGVPVVGTPRGSIPDLLGVVDPSLIADDVHPEIIAKTVLRVMKEIDRHEFAARAHRRVSTLYAWDNVVDRIEQCLETVIAGHSRDGQKARRSQ